MSVGFEPPDSTGSVEGGLSESKRIKEDYDNVVPSRAIPSVMQSKKRQCAINSVKINIAEQVNNPLQCNNILENQSRGSDNIDKSDDA